MIPYQLDPLQLTQEKEKSSVAQCSTGWFKNNFLEWIMTNHLSVKEWLWQVYICVMMQYYVKEVR